MILLFLVGCFQLTFPWMSFKFFTVNTTTIFIMKLKIQITTWKIPQGMIGKLSNSKISISESGLIKAMDECRKHSILELDGNLDLESVHHVLSDKALGNDSGANSTWSLYTSN
jgi:hypothetical protein